MRTRQILRLTGVAVGIIIVFWFTPSLAALPQNLNETTFTAPTISPNTHPQDQYAAITEALKPLIPSPYIDAPLPVHIDSPPVSEPAEDPPSGGLEYFAWMLEHILQVWPALLGGGMGVFLLYVIAKYIYHKKYVEPRERQRIESYKARL